MPRYQLDIRQTIEQIQTVILHADNAQAAQRQARQLINNGTLHFEDFTEMNSTFDIMNIEEV